jgi:hypothetical protein
VTALDGNRPAFAVLDLAPGERIDAIVEMSHFGVWVLGKTGDAQRTAGADIVVEYAETRNLALPFRPSDGQRPAHDRIDNVPQQVSCLRHERQ